MGIRNEMKAQSLNGRLFQATLTALVMALRKVKTCCLTNEIIVNTRRKDVIDAINTRILRTLNKKTNSNALTTMECHAIMNGVAISGALVSFQKVTTKYLEDTNEMAKIYAGSHPETVGGGSNSNSKIIYNHLPELNLPSDRRVP